MMQNLSRPSNRGLTLIEVVAALVLAATVVTALLLAINRSLEQQRITQRQAFAAELARELILEWSITKQEHGNREEGEFEGTTLSWKRIVKPSDLTRDGDLLEVNLEVYASDRFEKPDRLVRYTWLEPNRPGSSLIDNRKSTIGNAQPGNAP